MKEIANRLMSLARKIDPFEYDSLSDYEKQEMVSNPLGLCTDMFEDLAKEENFDSYKEYCSELIEIIKDIHEYYESYKCRIQSCVSKVTTTIVKKITEIDTEIANLSELL